MSCSVMINGKNIQITELTFIRDTYILFWLSTSVLSRSIVKECILFFIHAWVMINICSYQ